MSAPETTLRQGSLSHFIAQSARARRNGDISEAIICIEQALWRINTEIINPSTADARETDHSWMLADMRQIQRHIADFITDTSNFAPLVSAKLLANNAIAKAEAIAKLEGTAHAS
jgi:hypothetical protein